MRWLRSLDWKLDQEQPQLNLVRQHVANHGRHAHAVLITSNTFTTRQPPSRQAPPISWLISLPPTGAPLPCQYWSYNHNSKPSPASELAAGVDFGRRTMVQVLLGQADRRTGMKSKSNRHEEFES